MGRTRTARRAAAVGFLGMALGAGAPWAWAALPAADNASDAAYGTGWSDVSNGGYGFGPWSIARNGGSVGIGSSTANGDTKPPAGDIDSAGGKSWLMRSFESLNTIGSARAVRPFVGALDVGQHVSFDVDANQTTGNADDFWISLGNAGGARWSLLVFSGGMRMWDGQSSLGALVGGYPVEGVHVDFLLGGPDMFTATMRGLDGSDPVSVSGPLDGAAGSGIDRITFEVSGNIGRVDAFYVNNLAVTPEPGAAVIVVGAGIMLARRVRR